MIERNEDARLSFKKLYAKVQDLNRERGYGGQKEKKSRKEEESGEKEGEAKNKKEQLLIFYNKLMVTLYHDGVNYASLREIGIDNYYEVTCKLMTLIHSKREKYLESEEKEGEQEVSDKIKQEISSYHNFYATRIEDISKLDEDDTLEKILLDIYPKLKDYEEYELFMNEVLLFFIDLMLLLALELKVYEANFVYIESTHLEKKKKDVILKYWQSTIKKIDKKMKGELAEVEELIKKERRHKEKKEKKERREHEGEEEREERKKLRKEKDHKKSR
jgi:hypothetical protein